MSILLRPSMRFRVPNLCSKIPKIYNWSMDNGIHSVCFRGGLALVCCTNPDNVHCFGTVFPNLNFVFVSICAARPVHIQSDQYRSCSTVKQIKKKRRAVVAAPFNPMGSNQKQRCGSEFATWYLYTKSMVTIYQFNRFFMYALVLEFIHAMQSKPNFLTVKGTIILSFDGILLGPGALFINMI